MSKLGPVLCLGLLASLTLADAASAQYYERPYYPPPGYSPGYYPRPPGNRCEARFRTPYGVREFVCELYEPKPLGFECHCPAPPPPPGYPPRPDPRGRVIP